MINTCSLQTWMSYPDSLSRSLNSTLLQKFAASAQAKTSPARGGHDAACVFCCLADSMYARHWDIDCTRGARTKTKLQRNIRVSLASLWQPKMIMLIECELTVSAPECVSSLWRLLQQWQTSPRYCWPTLLPQQRAATCPCWTVHNNGPLRSNTRILTK